jgi:hypothetical protein
VLRFHNNAGAIVLAIFYFVPNIVSIPSKFILKNFYMSLAKNVLSKL